MRNQDASYTVGSEQTFWAYTRAQGKTYASDRPRHSLKLFEIIIGHHISTGGQLDTVVKTRRISAARSYSVSTTSPVLFEVSAAEALGADLEPPKIDGRVDLLTAATEPRWLGGNIALWAGTGMSVDSTMTPNGAVVEAIVDEKMSELSPYMDLILVSPVEESNKERDFRKEWNRNRGSVEKENGDLSVVRDVAIEFVRVLGTGRPAGTEEGIVRKLRVQVGSLLHEGINLGEEGLRRGAWKR
ncbi:S-adenosyl-L-methionine-dependent methyltransferase [Hypoxylon sp. FL0890]|nr:S-adenosyl-L-methionine-dependent methyltransferase [Hypoxylon sp. FL0890]